MSAPEGEQSAAPEQEPAGAGEQSDERASLRRLRRGHALAWIAAVALIFTMALDWYTDVQGEDARRTESIYAPRENHSDEVGGPIREDAQIAAEKHEQNAFQADAAIDRLILIGLLATALLAVAAGILQGSGRRFDPPLTPSALTALVGAVTGVLLVYRLALNQPGLDAAAEIKFGAVLSLVVLAVLIRGAADALRSEQAADDGDATPTAPVKRPWDREQVDTR